MKRGVNVAALLTSLIGFAVLLGSGYFWYRLSMSRNAKTLYDYAEHCAETKDYPTAAAQFARYVQFCPDDATARVRLAETYDLGYSKTGRAQRTIELYHEALGVAPEAHQTSIHGRLGELLLETQQYIAAGAEAEAVLKQDLKNRQAMNLRARALYGQARQGIFKGKPETVGAAFETALANDPGDRPTAVTFARIYREEPRYLGEAAQAQHAADREQAADRIVDRLVAAHTDQPEVHLARYQYRVQYHLPGADADLEEARRLGPKNLDVLLASADALRREAADIRPSPTAADKVRAFREAARSDYQKAVAVAADDYRGYLGLGETQSELGQAQAAIDTWNRGLQAAPAATSLFDIVLANGLVSQGQINEAEKHLDRLSKKFEKLDPDSIPLEKALFFRKYQLIRANWLRGKNQPFKAIALAREVATGSTSTSQEVDLAVNAWLLLADTYSSLGRWAEAADSFEKAVEIVPSSPRYRALAAAAWMKANQPDRAIRAPCGKHCGLATDPSSGWRWPRLFSTNTAWSPQGDRDWQAVQAALADARLAQAKQPLQEPWRLSFLEAEIALSEANADGRQAEGVRAAAAIYRNIKLDEQAQKTVLPALAMAFERLGLHDDADRTAATWEKSVAPRKAPMLRAQLAASRARYDEARRLVQADLETLAPRRALVRAAIPDPVELSMSMIGRQRKRSSPRLPDFGPRDLDLFFAYAELAAGTEAERRSRSLHAKIRGNRRGRQPLWAIPSRQQYPGASQVTRQPATS